jgi:LuxR family maltose regulon positive regulatory protein
VVFLAVLRALVSWRTQDHSNAYRSLHTALKSLEGIGFTRSHYDDAPGLDRLLALAVTSGKLPGTLPRDYFTKYASVLGDIAPPGSSNSRRAGNGVSATPLEPLTDRETNVLRLLALGLSNQEICARSNIAITTTKWHLKNIFAKLDVGSRTAALARARALRLID